MSNTVFSILSVTRGIDPPPVQKHEFENMDDDAVLFDQLYDEWCFVKRVFKYDAEVRGTYYHIQGTGMHRPAEVGDVVLCYFSDVKAFANYEDLFKIVPFEENRFYFIVRPQA